MGGQDGEIVVFTPYSKKYHTWFLLLGSYNTWRTFEMRLLEIVSSADPGLRWGGAWGHRRCGTCFCRLQMPQMLRGSFDQALWPQAFVVRGIKPAVCLHSHLLLGRSSLPFASLQMPKMLRGSFDQPSNPQRASRQLQPGTLATRICC